jgi:hypothetical protein
MGREQGRGRGIQIEGKRGVYARETNRGVYARERKRGLDERERGGEEGRERQIREKVGRVEGREREARRGGEMGNTSRERDAGRDGVRER